MGICKMGIFNILLSDAILFDGSNKLVEIIRIYNFKR
jgi:hypothetical protein